MYNAPMISPAIDAPINFPLTMVVLLIGNVSKVSMVLFSFSLPMDDMTILPIITMTNMIIIGTNIV